MPFNMPLSHGLLLLATSLVHAVGTGAQQAFMGGPPPSVEPISTIAGDNAMLLDFMNAVAGQAGAGDGKTINALSSKLDAANPLYSGIPTFMHLRTLDCASSDSDGEFDIGVVGMPFDLGVTYRPGARFGPGAARMASRRIRAGKTYDMDHRGSVFDNWATLVDCGDISNTPFDKLEAMRQLTNGSKSILARTPKATQHGDAVRMLSVGGDHTITLPILRALAPIWGPVSVLHFDAHLDTWSPDALSNGDHPSSLSEITHGTMLHLAHQEGLMSNDSNMHIGSRCGLGSRRDDLGNDARCGFDYIRARQLDVLGIDGVVDRIVQRVGGNYVYVSVDIDVLDPAFAPATGTAEPGGLTSRELLQILQSLSDRGLKIVGADVVELSPPFDTVAEQTALAYVQVAYELLHWMVNVPVQRPQKTL